MADSEQHKRKHLDLTFKNPCWIKSKGVSGRLNIVIKKTIPIKYRIHDHNGIWLVHWKYLVLIIREAIKDQYTIDYNKLPERYQNTIQTCMLEYQKNSDDINDLYGTLYVTKTAPFVVIKAAYKALVTIYHPDTYSGSITKIKRINAAFQKLKQIHQKEIE